MAMTRFSRREIEGMKKLKQAHEAKQGDAAWIEELPELPESPTGEGMLAIMIQKRGEKNDESNTR